MTTVPGIPTGSDRQRVSPRPVEQPVRDRGDDGIGASFDPHVGDRDVSWSDTALLQSLIVNSPLALCITDEFGIVQMWNPASEQLYGWSEREAIGQPPLFVSSDLQEEYKRLIRRAFSGKPMVNVEITREHKSGRKVEVLTSALPLSDDEGVVRAVLVMSQDVTAHKAAEAALQRQIRFDPLTGLDNRAWFFERVSTQLATSRRSAGFVRLEINDFKAINDTYGYAIGDVLLGLFADRIRSALRGGDIISRFGDNEFAVFAPGVGVRGIRTIVERIFAALVEPFLVAGKSFSLRAWAGGVPCDATARVDDLVRATDFALQEAKQSGGGGMCVFDEALHAAVIERVRIEADFRSDKATNNMMLHYQPIIDTGNGAISGVEALARWNHSQFGLLSPSQFIPAAETTGEIVALGAWVLREACLQGRAWHNKFPNLSSLMMSVNVSSHQLRDKNLSRDVLTALEESQFDPNHLQLEVTESALADESSRDALRLLRDLGVRLAIDDFGTGASSFTMLRRFPFTAVKISQSFVAGLAKNSEDRAIVLSTINLAQHLGLTSIAVGVETAEQLDFLTYHGCDKAQGFFIGRPLPAMEAGELLDASEGALH